MNLWIILLDWRVISLLSIMVLLYLRAVRNESYLWLWRKLRWRISLVIPAAALIALMIFREILIFPVAHFQSTYGLLPNYWQLLTSPLLSQGKPIIMFA